MEGDTAGYCYLFGGAAAHVVIGAFDDGVRLRQNHPVGGVTAPGGSRYPGVIRLRERKAIHRHGFCGDVAGGQGVVGLALRSNMILYPLR